MEKRKITIQEYLSLGYVYLIILGIISNVIFYKILNVDILNYSTILDVILTPITIISQDILMMSYFIVGTVAFILLLYKGPQMHYKFREKKWYQKLNNVQKLDERYKDYDKNKNLPVLALIIFSMFIGYGIGSGYNLKSQIESGDLNSTHTILFNNAGAKDISIIGQNSTYIFYVEKYQKEISISPIVHNIKEIRQIISE